MGASLSALSHALEQPENEQLLRSAFVKYDKDKSGRLERSELACFASDCRELARRRQPDNEAALVDERAFIGMVLEEIGKPSLSFEEFCAFVRGHRRLEDFHLVRPKADQVLCEFYGKHFVAGPFDSVFDHRWQEILWNSGRAMFANFPAFEDMTIFMNGKQFTQLGHFNLYLNGCIALGSDEYVISLRDGSSAAPLTLEVKAVVDGRLRSYKVSAGFRAPVAELRSAVAATTGLPAASLTLFYRGKVLRDEQTLSELGMHDGDELSFAVLPK